MNKKEKTIRYGNLSLLLKRLEACELCPHRCGVNRIDRQTGKCGETDQIRIASHNIHKGEEPEISGIHGSGTIFFSGCSLSCQFCQNYPISQFHNGKIVTNDQLTEIMLNLEFKKAHNINLVTPTHFAPQIYSSVISAREKGLSIPVAYNNSGYEEPEILKIMTDIIDIFMYDVKYQDSNLAYKLSGVFDYPEINFRGLEVLIDILGDEEVKDSQGILKKGIILRHLVLPGFIANSFKVIDMVSSLSKTIHLGLMNQYFPAYKAQSCGIKSLRQRLGGKEYDKVINYALKKGMSNILIQNFPDDI